MYGKQVDEHGDNWGNMFVQTPVTDSTEIIYEQANNKKPSMTKKATVLADTKKYCNDVTNNSFYKNTINVKDTPAHLKTYEDRLKNYMEVRAKIFDCQTTTPKSKITKTRERYQRRKHERNEISSTLLETHNDIRPYMDVEINGIALKGLMDSGASISCLGRNCLENVQKMDSKILDFKSQIKTADGTSQQIIGNVKVTIKFGSKSKDITLYLVPNLKQDLILGYDFWKCVGFTITPKVLEITEVENDVPKDPKIHDLSEQQKHILEHVKSYFKCYTKYGLGKTNLETHIIDTGDATPKKMRYYPVSPAVQKLTYAELDRMLELDVIEVAKEAEWNNRTTLVIKPNKNRLCLDARELNNIDGLLARLGDTHFI